MLVKEKHSVVKVENLISIKYLILNETINLMYNKWKQNHLDALPKYSLNFFLTSSFSYHKSQTEPK
jgi:hypothetical protein